MNYSTPAVSPFFLTVILTRESSCENESYAYMHRVEERKTHADRMRIECIEYRWIL